MVSGLFSTARELPRVREISMIFVRHGLGDLVRRAGIATLLEQAGHVLHWGEATEIAHLEVQQRARLAFEQSAGPDSALARLRQIADHLPGGAIAGRILAAGPAIGRDDQHLDFVAKPGEAFTRQFVRFRVVGRQPAGRVDPIQDVVGHVEGEVQAFAVVLHIAFQR